MTEQEPENSYTMETMTAPTAAEIEEAIDNLADDLADLHSETSRLSIVGIANGGIPLAKALQSKMSSKLGREIPFGVADISFHRDDIGRNPIPKEMENTNILSGVDGATILLVDDVLFTGRSVRAAINEIFDLGRPDRLELVILYDRGGRKLPIQADHRAFYFEHKREELIEVTLDPENPENHKIKIS
jgi:pyrimidine operon attenuation protein/uracil phosphoribosyltransferase